MQPRFLHTIFALVLTLQVVACGSPRLLHLDGTPFLSRLPLAHLDGGWLAVDSCAAGVHALLALDMEVTGRASVREMAFPIQLRHDAGSLPPVRYPAQVLVDGPLCEAEKSGYASRMYDPVGLPRWYMEAQDGPPCVYRVWAQFRLRYMPAAGDSAALRYGGRDIPVSFR